MSRFEESYGINIYPSKIDFAILIWFSCKQNKQSHEWAVHHSFLFPYVIL